MEMLHFSYDKLHTFLICTHAYYTELDSTKKPPTNEKMILCPLYCNLSKIFLCFVFRRKRKGKGAKGKARSGGKNQKGTKLQGKSPLPSPTAHSATTKLLIPEEKKAEETEKIDKPDGVPTTDTKGKENTRKGNGSGWENLFSRSNI